MLDIKVEKDESYIEDGTLVEDETVGEDEKVKVCRPPKTEEELVALANLLGLDWAKVANILSNMDPTKITANVDEINKVKVGGETEMPISNAVSKEKLRAVQLRTIKDIAEKVMATFGPMESNTSIIRGSSMETMVTKYSKDGHTVLKALQYLDPIEMSIRAESENITRRVEKEVGDGTSSAIEMAAIIFEEFCNLESASKYRPYQIIRSFQKVVGMIKDEIANVGRPMTLDDVYDISMISTNGNKEIADKMRNIYEKFGSDVYVDVKPSTSKDDIIKEYDGMTIDVGYSDAAYINGGDGTSTIRNPRIYHFIDPIDTREMIGLFEKIVAENIMIPVQNDGDPIPTVIVSPIMSGDMSSLMEMVVQMLYGYNQSGALNQKPPILIITNLGPYVPFFDDISRLCGCKPIRKYLDPENQKIDVEAGRAPTLDNVTTFYGTCEEICADVSKTKFINPGLMYENDDDGNKVFSHMYDAVLKSLEGELINAQDNKSDANTIGNLKRRINSLKANMIDFFVGGMTISDRDNKRDLVEDCVLSCRSASKKGVGFAANFEGYMASMNINAAIKAAVENDGKLYIGEDDVVMVDECDKDMAKIIASAYNKMQIRLYSTYTTDAAEVDKIIRDGVLTYGNPFNLSTEKYDGKVITSIDTDCVILDSIARIVTLMFTANQAMLPSAVGNKYL